MFVTDCQVVFKAFFKGDKKMIRTEIDLLNSYLTKNIGAKMKILEEDILDSIKLPLFLKRKYSSARVEFMDHNCLLLFPTKNINTRDFSREIQKIYSKLNESTNYSFKIIIILPKAPKNIITFFIERRIPFIIGNKQVYLPFVYLDIQYFENISVALDESAIISKII